MPTDDAPAVLVIGAYGQVGRRLTLRLAAEGYRVLAGGRRRSRLEALAADAAAAGHAVEAVLVDAANGASVRGAAKRAAVVINCVGPFVSWGPPVAAAAVDAGAHYLDIASEQAHYRALQGLAPEAERRGTLLIPGAGLYPGLSGMLLQTLLTDTPGARCASLAMVTGIPADPASGVASLMTGILELGFPLEHLRNYVLEPVEPTSSVSLEVPRYAQVEAVRWPMLEVLSLGPRHRLEDFDTYAALGGAPAPRPVEVALVRLLAPHRRRWAYRLAAWFARRENARLYAAGRRRGWGTACVVRSSVTTGTGKASRTLIAEDMVAGTCALPLRLTRALVDGAGGCSGLVTPGDLLHSRATLDAVAADASLGVSFTGNG